jgi:hypothetical protein
MTARTPIPTLNLTLTLNPNLRPSYPKELNPIEHRPAVMRVLQSTEKNSSIYDVGTAGPSSEKLAKRPEL